MEMTENGTGTAVIECAINIHRELGPRLLETVNVIEDNLCVSVSLREKNKFKSVTGGDA